MPRKTKEDLEEATTKTNSKAKTSDKATVNSKDVEKSKTKSNSKVIEKSKAKTSTKTKASSKVEEKPKAKDVAKTKIDSKVKAATKTKAVAKKVEEKPKTETATKTKAVAKKVEEKPKAETATKTKAVAKKVEEKPKAKAATKTKAVAKKVEEKPKTKAATKTKAVAKKVEEKPKTKTATKTKAVTKKVEAKTTTKTTKKVAKNINVLEYYDLPYRYNKTIVKILAQTPNTLFVYWDISDDDRKKYVSQYGKHFFNDTKPVLIVHNTTMNYSFEIEIDDFANSWYFNVNDEKCEYVVELGRKPKPNFDIHIPNNYLYITSSNVIESPNGHILFEKEQKVVYFRNVITNIEYAKDIATLNFLRYMGKIYNIYEMYHRIYNDEEILDLNNPSSGNPTSRFK